MPVQHLSNFSLMFPKMEYLMNQHIPIQINFLFKYSIDHLTFALVYSTAFFAVKSHLFPTNNLFTLSLA